MAVHGTRIGWGRLNVPVGVVKVAAVVGLDLGTTFTVAALAHPDGPELVVSCEALPSVVGFGADGPLVGQAAVELGRSRPQVVARSVKRHMGSSWAFTAAGRRWSAVELSALVVAEAARMVREATGEEEVAAVVTVPAYFSSPQRAATADAVRAAGVTLLGMVNEPTAAALAYGVADAGEPSKVIVVDVGGGTTDVSVLSIDGAEVTVSAVAGDNRLGGDDFDEMVRTYLADRLADATGVDVAGDAGAWARLLAVAERAKDTLSFREVAPVGWPEVLGKAFAPDRLTRAEFELLTAPLVERVMSVVSSACTDAGVSAREVDALLLVGGSTQIPALVERFEQLAGDPGKVHRQVGASEVVALGAAVAAGAAAGVSTKVRIRDVTPLTLGVETVDGLLEPVVRRNTPVPVEVARTFTTATDNQVSVLVGVYQGERPVAALNRKLASVELSGLPPAGRGVPEIEVVFSIDSSGQVSVSVEETSSGVSAQVVAAHAVWLDSDAVSKALALAASNVGEDKLLSARLRSQARVERLLEDAGAWAGSDAESVREAAAALVAASDGGNLTLVDLAASKLEGLLTAGR